MKKIIVSTLLLTFLIIGCQESSSIVAPENSDLNLDKKSNPTEFVPNSIDTLITNGNRPGFPRV